MALSKKIKLDNGVESSYHIISLVETIGKEQLKVTIDSFKTKSIYEKAIQKSKALKEQDELIEALDSEKDETKLNKLKLDINNLADKISTMNDYNDYVIARQVIFLPFMEDLNIDNIEAKLEEVI